MGLFKNWKPKTKVGKVLKGVTIGATAVAAVATGVGAVAGAAGGVGLLAGAAKGLGTVVRGVKALGGGTKTVMSKISGGASKLLTGQSKEENEIIKQAKLEARTAAQSNTAVDKLMKLGVSENDARIKLGLPILLDTKTEDAGTDFLSKMRAGLFGGGTAGTETGTGTAKMPDQKALIYGGLGLAALLFLPKLLK